MAGSAGSLSTIKTQFEGEAPETEYSVEIERHVLAPPRVVAAALLDPRDVMRYTRAPAVGPAFPPSAGDLYTHFSGSVQGQFDSVDIDDKLCVVQSKWRFRDWHDGVYATYKLRIAEEGYGRSIVQLTIANIPERDRHDYDGVEAMVRRGWEEHIFDNMGTIMGLVTEKK